MDNPAGAMAITLSHEIEHVTGTGELGELTGGQEESRGWERAMGVFDEFQGSNRDAYDEARSVWRENRDQYLRTKCQLASNFNRGC